MTAIQYFQQNKMQLIQFIQFIVTISSLAQQQQQKILVIFQSQLILMCLSVQSNQLFVFFSPVEWRTRLSTRIFKSSTFVQRRLFFSVKNHRIEWLQLVIFTLFIIVSFFVRKVGLKGLWSLYFFRFPRQNGGKVSIW